MDIYVERIRNCLIEKARKGDVITYMQLSLNCGLSTDLDDKYVRQSLRRRIEYVLKLEAVIKKRPPLTILVVETNDLDEPMPKKYFFEIIQKLNLNLDNLDDESYFLKEKKRVIETWSNDIFYNHFKYDF